MRHSRRHTRVVPIHVGNEGVHDLRTAFPGTSSLGSTGKTRAIGLLLLLLIVGGIVFWRSGWNSLPLTDRQIANRILSDDPKELERCLVGIGERVRLQRPAQQWYPDVLRLASNPDEKVRARAAWVMGLDTRHDEFHAKLATLLKDPAPDVRGFAGVSLASFGDRTGHPQISEWLTPLSVIAPHSGEIVSTRRINSVRVGGVIATMRNGEATVEVKSPIAGVLGRISVRVGDTVSAGVPIAVVYPSAEHAWDALHALENIGDISDLEVVKIYQSDVPGMPQDVVDEASAAERAIRKRTPEAR